MITKDDILALHEPGVDKTTDRMIEDFYPADARPQRRTGETRKPR